MDREEVLMEMEVPRFVFVSYRGDKLPGFFCDYFILSIKHLSRRITSSYSKFKVLNYLHLNEILSLEPSRIKEEIHKLKKALKGIPASQLDECLLDRRECEFLLPFQPVEFVDFYACRNHVENMGRMFRDPRNPLPPAWLYFPVAYEGRASTIVTDGARIRRPEGVFKKRDGSVVVGPSSALDFELELAFLPFAIYEKDLPLSPKKVSDYLFGIALLNDLTARDIQRFEYVPLGPFYGKNFATAISPVITFLDALQFCKIDYCHRREVIPPHLISIPLYSLSIELEVYLKTPGSSSPDLISRTNSKELYWTFEEMLYQFTYNGCRVRAGDVFGSGTISGKSPSEYGSIIELTQNGENPLILKSGVTRTFLEDGDTVIFRATAFNSSLNKKYNLGWLSVTIEPPLNKHVLSFTP